MPDLGGLYSGGGYIRAGLYADRSDISGELLQKISKSLYFKHNVEKNLLHVVFIKFKRFSHVSDDIPVANFTQNFVRACSDDKRNRDWIKTSNRVRPQTE